VEIPEAREKAERRDPDVPIVVRDVGLEQLEGLGGVNLGERLGHVARAGLGRGFAGAARRGCRNAVALLSLGRLDGGRDQVGGGDDEAAPRVRGRDAQEVKRAAKDRARA
jgi:hypothetical protein